jgi:plasmid stabilization system protein ParE
MPGQHSAKEKRQAEHIKEGYKKKGVSAKEAESRAWATVNKKSGSKKR